MATTMKQATIAKITVKTTGYVFYQIKSDRSNEYYQLHKGADGKYHCNCPAHKPCKHERALAEVLEAQIVPSYSVVAEAQQIVVTAVIASDEEQARRRAEYVAAFDPCGFGY